MQNPDETWRRKNEIISIVLSCSDIVHPIYLFVKVCNLPLIFFKWWSVFNNMEDQQPSENIGPKTKWNNGILSRTHDATIDINTLWQDSQHKKKKLFILLLFISACSSTIDSLSLQHSSSTIVQSLTKWRWNISS